MPLFESGAFDHSATLPVGRAADYFKRLNEVERGATMLSIYIIFWPLLHGFYIRLA